MSEINRAIQERLTIFLAQPFQKMNTSRRELYEILDKPALKPLPSEPYEHAEWKIGKIHIDYHFVFDHHHYSAPHKFIHQSVEIRATARTVECFHKGIRISVHPRSFKRYGYSTLHAHMPEAHRIQAEWSPERMYRWAQKIGPKTAAFIDMMIAARAFPEQAYRACLGVLRLSNKYSEERLEKACAKGLAVGATRYNQIESMLKHGLEKDPEISGIVTLPIPSHNNIRGPGYTLRGHRLKYWSVEFLN